MGHPVGLVVDQLLHAASFGSMHVASIHLCHYYFHGPHHGRGQALYSSVSFGLGAMFGSYGSGLLWERLGADWVFMLAAGVALLALLVAWCWVGKDLQSEGFNTAA